MNKLNFKTFRRKILYIFKMTSGAKPIKLLSESLESLIPVFLISAFIQVLINFPIPAYQSFIHDTFEGLLYEMLRFIHLATYDMLSVFMTIAVADSVNRIYGKASHRLAVIITSLVGFFIISGIFNNPDSINLDLLGPKNILTAILCGMLSAYIYILLLNKIVFQSRKYVDGISTDFATILISLLPMIIVLEFFAIINLGLVTMGYKSFYVLLTGWFKNLFINTRNSLANLIRFELLQNLMWMCGIHGSDALGEIKYQIFDVALDYINKPASGLDPILTGVFIDVFVLLGGCGSTWSLIIALLIFSKQKNDKFLARTASIPMIFNINELLILGLPIIFNPVFLIPFLLAPIANILICYCAMALGLVPVATHAVNWTTPIIFGGYIATGSVAGSVLQIVCIIVGTLIYFPFVRINDRIKFMNSHEKVRLLEDILKECEESREPVEFLTLPGDPGRIARTLAAELSDYIDSDDFVLYYQPQFNEEHVLIGAEALLRWTHEQYGPIYPPLAIALAEELNRLTELEEKIFLTVFRHLDELLKYKEDENFHISINVTGITIQTDEFEDFLKNLHIIYPGKCKHVLIEITEQATLKVDDNFIARLQRIKTLGYTFGIDDFSMGNTSIKYLQSSIFDIVKLDGGISRDVFNERSREIISSISRLTEGLNIETIAEYVETEEQRKALEDVGCHIYQGYLYSPAIPLSKFKELGERALDERNNMFAVTEE
ncbi:MAG: EAL domain-containing protein [Lachnospiraceae bacterium]|nr:EAL domain-containing protein [Lachnospiraceae bacterium]